LSKEASFRLVVTGNVGVQEIERLIKKLELDKEILADQDSETEGAKARSPSTGTRASRGNAAAN
jgi:hypothetical protein